MLRLARLLRIRQWLAVAAVAYLGVSPAIVNSACSIFSEVLVTPFVLTAAVLIAGAWAATGLGDAKRAVLLAVAAAAAFAFGAFTKGLLHFVSLLVVLAFGARAVWAWRGRRRRTAVAAFAFAATTLALTQAAFLGYKEVNRRCNGSFEFTNRYPKLLYGNAAKRALPFTTRQYLAHLAAIPGDGVCRMLFFEDECELCEFGAADNVWFTELPSRLEDVPPSERRAATLRLSLEKVMENPAQYTFVGMTEVLRMPFWESTQIGFVVYPPWLGRAYAEPAIRFGLRLLAGFLTALALVRAVTDVARTTSGRPPADEGPSGALAAVVPIVASFMVLHAPFSVVTRHALPIAPLYLLLVARLADGALGRPVRPL